MFTLDQVEAAHRLVGEAVPPTPSHGWPLLGERLGAEVFVKHENHTPTGAFKVRGGLTYLDWLKRERPQVAGVVSATRGNHGQSIAFAARRLGLGATIVVPRGNSTEKNAAMRAFGAELLVRGGDFQEAREEAERIAVERGHEMVPSYHEHLVLGVSTYALEMLSKHRDLDVLYVPIGLGSGICGCILVRDLLGLKIEIVGVQAERAPAYALSFEAGRPISTNASDTFADGMATRVPDAEALKVILRGAARIVQIGEEEIAEAMRIYWTDTHNLAEGAGAAALAAALKEGERNRGRRVGLVLSGGNIDLDLFRRHVFALAGNHDVQPEAVERRA
ncbi:threonine dehydratase [Nitratireductor mangrovi]|uniref:Threonine dehydratase n=1 Tax=Nitratireductor mangrovi TaxID=2599600 RepID=A0A5B8KUG9_9HYPH|nr:threonine dehydratase [Nitratireductor mangrovi]QDY99243.1 threonine dehydratase [Nitratireductor mangrovi]